MKWQMKSMSINGKSCTEKKKTLQINITTLEYDLEDPENINEILSYVFWNKNKKKSE